MEQKTKNYLKLGILLFGVYLLSIKCQPDITFDPNKKINAKTVSFEQAKAFFKENKPKTTYLKNGNSLILNPDWSTLIQEELNYTDALLTKAETDVNRNGNFQSQLVFINIDNQIRSVIATSWSTDTDSDNNLLDGFLFLNEYDGTFIDAFEIENGLFTKRIVPNQDNVQQASMFSVFSLAIGFQTNAELAPEDCWNTDTLDLFEGGELDAVDLGAIHGGGSSDEDWTFTDGVAQAPEGTSSTTYGDYINGSIGINGYSSVNTNDNVRGISSNGIGQAAVAILLNSLDNVLLDDEGIGREKECQKIKKLFIDNPTLQQELIDLKALIPNSTTERGRYKLSGSSIIQNPPIGVNGFVDFQIPSGNNQYQMIVHFHNGPATNTYSVFSYGDLLATSELLRLGKIDTSKFVSFLITADGTIYAMTIDKPIQFLQVFATVFDDGFNEDVGFNRVEQRELYYLGDSENEIKPLIQENSDDNLSDEKLFLDFLENTNMGITLFEGNDTFDTFKKVTHNKDTDNIDKDNCK